MYETEVQIAAELQVPLRNSIPGQRYLFTINSKSGSLGEDRPAPILALNVDYMSNVNI